ncbi:ras-related protein Rab-24 isoform X2 [Dunckerocampus dactyliophorus]|uniref:ras-related protein Rab-24 isoform X2 n=1 Tax=Dunckerocampus dactyliophorus TaxID=161453 RepID=UPI0024052C97|nr:ras-related protein Rab-24 isoform X2 [Dunckerocampus dactyliophorus]
MVLQSLDCLLNHLHILYIKYTSHINTNTHLQDKTCTVCVCDRVTISLTFAVNFTYNLNGFIITVRVMLEGLIVGECGCMKHYPKPQCSRRNGKISRLCLIYASGFVDLTDSSSFQRARFWVKELQNCEEHCKIYLCGTKNDLVQADRSLRQIDYHDAQDFAEEIGAQHFETSSKTGNNVDDLFQKVAEDYNNAAFQYMTEETGVDLGQKKDSYFYVCCNSN